MCTVQCNTFVPWSPDNAAIAQYFSPEQFIALASWGKALAGTAWNFLCNGHIFKFVFAHDAKVVFRNQSKHPRFLASTLNSLLINFLLSSFFYNDSTSTRFTFLFFSLALQYYKYETSSWLNGSHKFDYESLFWSWFKEHYMLESDIWFLESLFYILGKKWRKFNVTHKKCWLHDKSWST